jgi:putative sigma-54 modulation protein
MEVIIQGHGLHLTPALKQYAYKKFSKLTQFFSNIQKVEVVLDARNLDDAKRSQVTEAIVWAAGKKVLRASEAGQDMYAAIDLAFEEIKRQVKKHKEKHRQERRRQGNAAKAALHIGLPAERENSAGEKTVIVRVYSFINKPLREDEALEEFKIANQDFLFFRNADTGETSIACLKNKKPKIVSPKKLKKLTPEQAQKEIGRAAADFLPFKNSITNETNIIYKRKSGNFGLVEPTL